MNTYCIAPGDPDSECPTPKIECGDCDFFNPNPQATTPPKSDVPLDGLLGWHDVSIVNKEGWYWIKNSFQETRVEFIRNYCGKWCIFNWEIDQKAKYAGPIQEPT